MELTPENLRLLERQKKAVCYYKTATRQYWFIRGKDHYYHATYDFKGVVARTVPAHNVVHILIKYPRAWQVARDYWNMYEGAIRNCRCQEKDIWEFGELEWRNINV
jgi:hypothetical protein